MPNSRYTLYNDDCRVVCDKVLQPNSIDSVICDPPYGLKFMGKDWDHGVPGVGFWTRILRVCKPGAILLAFGGTRTHHRLACAVEDAGWEIRDCVMWLYGSGFPKSLNVSKAIDKAAGVEFKSKPASGVGFMNASDDGYNTTLNQLEKVGESTEAAKTWEGYGTALKPAWEPVIVAMKPLDGTYAQNALKHGVAGINVDGCRVGYKSEADKPENAYHYRKETLGQAIYKGSGFVDAGMVQPAHSSGRFPANVIHDGSEEVLEGFPERKGGAFPETQSTHNATSYSVGKGKIAPARKMGDSGSAARFFYCAKASKKERNAGLEGFEERSQGCYGKYAGDGRGRQTEHTPTQNHHPTVKPLALMEYLCKLTMTPTGGTVLDPFMGSGSTGVACANVGRRFIGIENDTEHSYFEIAQQRVKEAYQKK